MKRTFSEKATELGTKLLLAGILLFAAGLASMWGVMSLYPDEIAHPAGFPGFLAILLGFWTGVVGAGSCVLSFLAKYLG